MDSIQTFMICSTYALARQVCASLDQWDLSNQFLDMVHQTLVGKQDSTLYISACLVNEAEALTAAAHDACLQQLAEQADFDASTDFAEFLASRFTEYTMTVDDFISVMRFAETQLDNLYKNYEDGWLVGYMLSYVFNAAELHGTDVTFVADHRAIDLCNKLMKQL